MMIHTYSRVLHDPAVDKYRSPGAYPGSRSRCYIPGLRNHGSAPIRMLRANFPGRACMRTPVRFLFIIVALCTHVSTTHNYTYVCDLFTNTKACSDDFCSYGCAYRLFFLRLMHVHTYVYRRYGGT